MASPGGDDSDSGVSLDLSTEGGFANTTAWLRSNVVCAESTEPLLQLDLQVLADSPESVATIYMDPKDAYVVAFRGADGIYALKEEDRDVEKMLRDAELVGPKEKVRQLNLGTSHAELGTFDLVNKDGERKPRDFGVADLFSAAKLGAFSSKTDEVRFDQVKDALSLLVCLTSESARNKLVEAGFRRLYNYDRVTPDTVMQSYDQAKRLTGFAEDLEHTRVSVGVGGMAAHATYMLADRVERVEKRARELSNLIDTALEATGETNAKDFLSRALQGTLPKTPAIAASAGERIREMAGQLGITEYSKLSELVSLCRNPDAVRAAKAGVLPAPMHPRSGRV